MSEFIYKLFRAEEWRQAEKAKEFAGSADDLRDGFIHFSAASQLSTTFDKYFATEHNPILAAVDAGILGEALKWEVSRGGQKFPHLYGVLRLSDVHSIVEIRRDADGRPIFPPEIP
jgi:uncharacterized protein (DUF952 family)